jgi:hypothetical protein
MESYKKFRSPDSTIIFKYENNVLIRVFSFFTFRSFDSTPTYLRGWQTDTKVSTIEIWKLLVRKFPEYYKEQPCNLDDLFVELL